MKERRCEHCNASTVHAHGYYYKLAVPNNQQLKLKMSGKNLCSSCMVMDIASLETTVNKCLTCGIEKSGIGYTYRKGHSVIMLCNNWWNEGHNCIGCIAELLATGTPASDYYDNGIPQYA